MVLWILVALLAAANATAEKPISFTHVRSVQPHVLSAIADGYARSATFRQLVDSVEQLPCVVYVGTIVRLSRGMQGALLHLPVGASATPVLRVVVKTSLTPDESVAIIGHELQHIIEAVNSGLVSPGSNLDTAFDILDPVARA